MAQLADELERKFIVFAGGETTYITTGNGKVYSFMITFDFFSFDDDNVTVVNEITNSIQFK
jgi:hypothetical protein